MKTESQRRFRHGFLFSVALSTLALLGGCASTRLAIEFTHLVTPDGEEGSTPHVQIRATQPISAHWYLLGQHSSHARDGRPFNGNAETSQDELGIGAEATIGELLGK